MRTFDTLGPLTRAKPPLVAHDEPALVWDETADVVVVGFGGAGACAALEAQAQGASVIAVDRFASGGATALSGGVVYAGGTRIQQEAGVEDSAGQMYAYLSQELGDAVSGATLKRFCDQSAGSLDWLMSHGVRFKAAAAGEKVGTYPPEPVYLYYSGNEKSPALAAKARPAPRGHRTLGPSLTGKVLFSALHASATERGVRLLTHSPVRRLVLDAAGQVLGVEVAALSGVALEEHRKIFAGTNPLLPFTTDRIERAAARLREIEDGCATVKRLRARNGVVLATGGFVMNLEMMRRFEPVLSANYRTVFRAGSLGCDGTGIELGATAGGAVSAMRNFYSTRSLSPPDAGYRGILVNAVGERFINEDSYAGYIGKAIEQQNNGEAWLILDADTYRSLLWGCRPQGDGRFLTFRAPILLNLLFGGVRKAATVEGLSAKCGFQPGRLAATVETYNAAARAGADTAFGKEPLYLAEFGPGPYRAVDLRVGNRFAAVSAFTLGGLTVDEGTGAVRREDGERIGGLYAAGRAAAGLNSHNNLSGLSLADCVFSGRRAGAAAARGH